MLVPIKAFHDAKLRLSPVLSPARRAALARHLAARVLGASGGLPVSVVCDDHAVAAFAESHGAEVIWTPGLGLSGAVRAGVEHLERRGVSLAVVVHADLPRASRLDLVGREGAVTLAPDRRFDGTNVLAVPTGTGFGYFYGRGSFERHRQEAARLGLPVEILEDERFAADVDLPGDLELIAN